MREKAKRDDPNGRYGPFEIICDAVDKFYAIYCQARIGATGLTPYGIRESTLEITNSLFEYVARGRNVASKDLMDLLDNTIVPIIEHYCSKYNRGQETEIYIHEAWRIYNDSIRKAFRFSADSPVPSPPDNLIDRVKYQENLKKVITNMSHL